MRRVITTFFIFIIMFSSAYSAELKTRYGSIMYKDDAMLKKFNKRIRMGSLNKYLKKRKITTYKDEVKHKIDIIMNRIKTTLAMSPPNMKTMIFLYPSRKNIKSIYRSTYVSKRDPRAFYEPKKNIVFISVNDVNINVIAHEFAHVVIEHHYGRDKTPVKIHEMLAIFAENNFK